MRPGHSAFVTEHLAHAFAINATGLSLDEARLAHLSYALGRVPESLLGWSELCATPGHAAARCDAMHKSGGEALLLEFGVREGKSLRFLANASSTAIAEQRMWHGFDSWTGLPGTEADDAPRQLQGVGRAGAARQLQGVGGTRRAARRQEKLSTRQRIGWHTGSSSTPSVLPSVPRNVQLHAGLFNQTLPPFLDDVSVGRGPLAFAVSCLDVSIFRLRLVPSLLPSLPALRSPRDHRIETALTAPRRRPVQQHVERASRARRAVPPVPRHSLSLR